jgi:hypothetical protein
LIDDFRHRFIPQRCEVADGPALVVKHHLAFDAAAALFVRKHVQKVDHVE